MAVESYAGWVSAGGATAKVMLVDDSNATPFRKLGVCTATNAGGKTVTLSVNHYPHDQTTPSANSGVNTGDKFSAVTSPTTVVTTLT